MYSVLAYRGCLYAQGIEDTVSSHQNKLQQLTGEGERLCSLRNVGSDLIRARSAELKALWAHLIEVIITHFTDSLYSNF